MDPNSIVAALQATLDPAHQKEGEAALKQVFDSISVIDNIQMVYHLDIIANIM